MAPVTLQDILGCVDSTIKRWEYPFEETEAAKSWRAWGNDTVQKSPARQCALNILQRQWVDGELEPEYLRVDAVCALIEAMARKPKKVVKKTGRDLRHRALMRQTLKSCNVQFLMGALQGSEARETRCCAKNFIVP